MPAPDLGTEPAPDRAGGAPRARAERTGAGQAEQARAGQAEQAEQARAGQAEQARAEQARAGQGRRLPRRLTQLYAGLWLYGASLALFVSAGLGVAPWDVLHQGLARQTGLSIGTWVVLVGAAVLLLWVPLRQRPGLGTVSNALLVGVALDVTLAVLPPLPDSLAWRAAVLGLGVAVNALATALYVGARFGPGPRDGLMTGLAARGHSVRTVRTAIELAVLATGWLLGGTVGVGTVVYALAIGPLVQPLLPRLDVRPEPRS